MRVPTPWCCAALFLSALCACGGGAGVGSAPAGNAPVFTVQPASQAVALGGAATFTASASGSPAYQWKRGGVDIAGATAASYTIPVATIADAGEAFTVSASNPSGATLSTAATLTVNPPPVPAAFADLYPSLQSAIASFDHTVSAAWNGQKAPVAFGGELLTANANRGLQLLGANALAGVRLELDRLQALGLQSVTVCMGFPVLHAPFFAWNGDPQDAASMLVFYQAVAAEIHQRGMKMVVESSLLFPGVYSAGSGFNLAGYYASLGPAQLTAAHSAMLAQLAIQVRPDWINLGSEPDTQATLSGNAAFNTPSGFAALVGAEVAAIRAAGSTVPLGAGVGSWESGAAAFLNSLAGTGIDFFDLHAYPVNFGFLDKLNQLVDQGHALGKPVAISEAWLSKERDGEFAQYNAATDATIFARDACSFWAPQDQALLGALVKFAHWKQLLYLSPFWTKYLHAYLDYAVVQGLGPEQVMAQSNQAASTAMQAGIFTSTGVYYGAAIR